jgi:plasmid stabilization system protein ParE
MAGNRISWSKTATRQFEAAIRYIALDSVVNAEKVSEDILNELVKALKNPEFFPPDKFKQTNDGSYRAFEKHRYRVAYRFTNDLIRVLRIRHTSREPKVY